MSKEKRVNVRDDNLKKAQDRLDDAREKYGKLLQRGADLESRLKDYVADYQAEYKEKMDAYEHYEKVGKYTGAEPVKKPVFRPLADTYYRYAHVPLPEAAEYGALLGISGWTNKDLIAQYGDLSLSSARSLWADLSERLWDIQRQWNDTQASIDFDYEIADADDWEKELVGIVARETQSLPKALEVLAELKKRTAGKGK
jgi:hypothetical protein